MSRPTVGHSSHYLFFISSLFLLHFILISFSFHFHFILISSSFHFHFISYNVSLNTPDSIHCAQLTTVLSFVRLLIVWSLWTKLAVVASATPITRPRRVARKVRMAPDQTVHTQALFQNGIPFLLQPHSQERSAAIQSMLTQWANWTNSRAALRRMCVYLRSANETLVIACKWCWWRAQNRWICPIGHRCIKTFLWARHI